MNELRIVIVGADGKNRAWTPERKEKGIEVIRNIILHAEQGWIITDWIQGLPNKRNRIDRPEKLVIASGHCPIGEKKWYCVECNRFLEGKELDKETLQLHRKAHSVIQVYDEGGVDSWVEIMAAKLGIETKIFPAEVKQWPDLKCCMGCQAHHLEVLKEILGRCSCPCHKNKSWQPEISRIVLKGFRSRNLEMVDFLLNPPGGVLFNIEPKGGCRHCGGHGVVFKQLKGFDHPIDVECNFCEGTGNYSGGTWTMKKARTSKKEVHQIIIE